MPLRKLDAAAAFNNLKTNPFGSWPRADEPDNRFAAFADPAFRPGFLLEPGQRIFTIGSCFARSIETALAARGFDIPMLDFTIDKGEWGGDPLAVLNTYVPAVIAPQIRWAFGLEAFDLERHGAEVAPGRHVDLQLTSGFRPMPAAVVIARRERINAIYRSLANSHIVLITLGLIEAWFDHGSGGYINAAPPKSTVAAQPGRFELHVLEYNEVVAQLRDLVALLGQVCPADFRMILTVSPVPLTATFTEGDVAVANAYSKAVLRAAAEAIINDFNHIEYFPSYESVVLTERAIAFTEDQVHVTGPIVRFNVDRMIRRYVKAAGDETASEIVARAFEERKAGRSSVALKILQGAWARDPDNADLTVALAETQIRLGSGKVAEHLLLKHLAKHDNAPAHLLLAGYYNDAGRHQDAAGHAEQAAETGVMQLATSLQRIVAYYHLGRYEEGLAILDRIRFVLERKPLVIYWKARFNERLGRMAEAEDLYRQCNGLAEQADYMFALAEFLAAQVRPDEAREWVDRALTATPSHSGALQLRRALRGTSARNKGIGALMRGLIRP